MALLHLARGGDRRRAKREGRGVAVELVRFRANLGIHDRGTRVDVIVAEGVAKLVRPQEAALRVGSVELAVEKDGTGGDRAVPARAAAAEAKRLHRTSQTAESCYHNLIGPR